MLEGVVMKGIGGFYYVKTPHGIVECKARGKFRKEKIKPLVGDAVRIQILDNKNEKGVIEEILPRKNELIRPAVANIDQAVVVFAVKSPEPHLHILDRFLILAESKNVDCVICFNKIDLDEDQSFKTYEKIYKSAGYPVLAISTYNTQGFDALKEYLKDKVSVFAGPSGVGKSSILNKIQTGLVLKTGELSEKIERGKHTTRHAELMELGEGGFVLDTPGFSSFDLKMMGDIELQECYPEFVRYESECKFNGCTHINEPHCAIKEALENGEIDPQRYQRYIEIYTQLQQERRR